MNNSISKRQTLHDAGLIPASSIHSHLLSVQRSKQNEVKGQESAFTLNMTRPLSHPELLPTGARSTSSMQIRGREFMSCFGWKKLKCFFFFFVFLGIIMGKYYSQRQRINTAAVGLIAVSWRDEKEPFIKLQELLERIEASEDPVSCIWRHPMHYSNMHNSVWLQWSILKLIVDSLMCFSCQHAFTHLTSTKTDSVLLKINKNSQMKTRNMTQTCNN